MCRADDHHEDYHSLINTLDLSWESWTKTTNFSWEFPQQLLQTLVLLQPPCWCCVECVIHHEQDVCKEQHHMHMWHEQAIIEWSHQVISILLAATVWSFAHLLLRLSDRNKWCCDQDVKVVPDPALTKKTSNRCSLLQKGGDVVSRLVLHWMCDSLWRGCARRITPHVYVAQTSNNKSDHDTVISIVTCGHSVKFAHLLLRLSDHNSAQN